LAKVKVGGKRIKAKRKKPAGKKPACGDRERSKLKGKDPPTIALLRVKRTPEGRIF